jgi:hypothetical protein
LFGNVLIEDHIELEVGSTSPDYSRIREEFDKVSFLRKAQDKPEVVPPLAGKNLLHQGKGDSSLCSE